MRATLLVPVVVALMAACTSGGDDVAVEPATSNAPPASDASVATPVATTVEPVDVPATASVLPDPTTTSATRSIGTLEDGRPLPEGDQPAVIGPLGSTEVDIETDTGSVQIGSGDVPAIVPDGFPIPSDFVVQLATEAGDQAGFSGTSQAAFGELVEFYLGGLSEAGYAVTEDQLVEGTVAVLGFDGPDGRGQVAISGAPSGGRSVLVTFEL